LNKIILPKIFLPSKIIFNLNKSRFTKAIIILTQKTYQMKLKKIFPLLVLAISLTIVIPAFAADETLIANTEKPTREARALQLTTRLKEIRDMDKSNLTSSEKKALRKEVKEIKKEARDNKNGIYLSVGAIIIIILLLILLL
jgi:hypothetical protein